MTDFIKEKKIPVWATVVALYIGFCASSFMPFRGTWAAWMNSARMGVALDNWIVSFFIGGLIPLALYELITRVVYRGIQVRLSIGVSEPLRYALRFFYIPACVAIFLCKLSYLAAPIISTYGDLVFDLVITAAAFGLYLWYAAKRVEKEQISIVLYNLGGAFVIVYGFIELLAILTEVLL